VGGILASEDGRKLLHRKEHETGVAISVGPAGTIANRCFFFTCDRFNVIEDKVLMPLHFASAVQVRGGTGGANRCGNLNHFVQELRRRYHLRTEEIVPDGACLFRSLSLAIWETQDEHLEMRRQVRDGGFHACRMTGVTFWWCSAGGGAPPGVHGPARLP
jgi:hypothetical protein